MLQDLNRNSNLILHYTIYTLQNINLQIWGYRHHNSLELLHLQCVQQFYINNNHCDQADDLMFYSNLSYVIILP